MDHRPVILHLAGDARDTGGGVAALGVEGRRVALGDLRPSQLQVEAVCVLEAA